MLPAEIALLTLMANAVVPAPPPPNTAKSPFPLLQTERDPPVVELPPPLFHVAFPTVVFQFPAPSVMVTLPSPPTRSHVNVAGWAARAVGSTATQVSSVAILQRILSR